MELRDLIVTPILILIIYTGAYFFRPFVTDGITRRYFLPALTVRILGALVLGFVYQFYYDGGDTFNYHTHGSRQIWEAFMESPEKGLRLFFYDGSSHDVTKGGIYNYTTKILFITDPSSYAIVRLAFLGDLITFSTYSATAILFSLFSFVGMWMFFLTFYHQYPWLHKPLAAASFFIPSVFFWGSGILKDTVTLGCLGIAVYQIYRLFIVRKFFLQHLLLLLLSLYGLYVIKIYILMTFLPAAIAWVFMTYFGNVRSAILKIMLFPLILVTMLGLGSYAVYKAAEDNTKYSLSRIGETARVTAYDIRYYTGRSAGSGYSLGVLDGSLGSMLRLAPQALNVSMFRPYLWEVNNPLMLLSALESFTFLVSVIVMIASFRLAFFRVLTRPNIIFLLVFTVVFAFGVGVSTFNFGTLVRYKIPMLPFFGVALTLIWYYAKNARKVEELEFTE